MTAPEILFGTGASSPKDRDVLQTVIDKCIDSGICAFDTAPSYGTEQTLGEVLLSEMKQKGLPRERLWVQDKIDAWQMQERDGDVSSYIYAALKKMQLSYFDALLIHWPIREYFEKTYATLQQLKKEGTVRNVGICNVRTRLLGRLAGQLPDIVQIERNPLNTFSDEVVFCRENNIRIQDYSPLCKFCKDIAESDVLRRISDKYGKSIGQVVLRWHIDTGAAPIFTSHKAVRVAEYAEIFDFVLADEDIRTIGEMNQNYKIYLESVSCPGF